VLGAISHYTSARGRITGSTVGRCCAGWPPTRRTGWVSMPGASPAPRSRPWGT